MIDRDAPSTDYTLAELAAEVPSTVAFGSTDLELFCSYYRNPHAVAGFVIDHADLTVADRLAKRELEPGKPWHDDVQAHEIAAEAAELEAVSAADVRRDQRDAETADFLTEVRAKIDAELMDEPEGNGMAAAEARHSAKLDAATRTEGQADADSLAAYKEDVAQAGRHKAARIQEVQERVAAALGAARESEGAV